MWEIYGTLCNDDWLLIQVSVKIRQLQKTVKKHLDRALYSCYRLLVQNGECTQRARLSVSPHVTATVSFRRTHTINLNYS